MLRDLGLCWVASDMQQSGSPQNFCTFGTSVKVAFCNTLIISSQIYLSWRKNYSKIGCNTTASQFWHRFKNLIAVVLASLGKTEPGGYFKVLKRDFFKWKQLISTFPVFIDKKIRRFGYPKSTQLWWGCPSMHAYFIALPLNIWEKFLMNKFKSVKNCDFPSSWLLLQYRFTQ